MFPYTTFKVYIIIIVGYWALAFFFKDALFYLKAKLQRRGRETFYALLFSHDGCSGQSWAAPKPEALNFLGVFNVCFRAQELGTFAATSPGALERSWN